MKVQPTIAIDEPHGDYRPLVTLALFSYNQEKYVRQAVESVLAQTYEPVEVILSDDCSTDQTFTILKAVRNEYQGRATIRINQNRKNIGAIRHVNKIMGMVEGEFIVAFAGDDVSIPARTAILVNHWVRIGKPMCSIFTNALVINGQDESLGVYYKCRPTLPQSIEDYADTGVCWAGGFSHGWSKALYDRYGPITESTFQEDGAISFRALLNGGIHYIDKPTVHYRRHGENTYDIHNVRKFRRLCESELGLARGRLTDLRMSDHLTPIQLRTIAGVLRWQILKKTMLVKIPFLVEALYLARAAKSRYLKRPS